MDCRTDLRRVIIPGRLRERKVNIGKEVLPRGISERIGKEGSPRNLVGRDLLWKPNKREMLSWTARGVLRKKI